MPNMKTNLQRTPSKQFLYQEVLNIDVMQIFLAPINLMVQHDQEVLIQVI